MAFPTGLFEKSGGRTVGARADVKGLLPLPVSAERDRLAQLDWRMKLSDDECRELRDLARAGTYSQRRIAALFGVSQRLVLLYKRGELRKHLWEEG
jgi:hypothetical protein